MNGSAFAALVAAALIVLYLIWQKRNERKKAREHKPETQPEAIAAPTPELEAVVPAQAETTDAAPVAAEVAEPITVEDSEVVESVEGFEVAEAASEPLPSSLAVDAEELELADLESVPDLALAEEVAEGAEPVSIPAESAEVFAEIEATPEETLTGEEGLVAPPLEEPEPESVAAELSSQEIDALEAAELETAEVADSDMVEETEERAPLSATPVAVVEPTDFADLDAVSAPKEPTLPMVRLTLEAYSARLNGLEERQRALLAEAVARGHDAQRDRLQRELVIMNDKLALLADQYVEELASCQQVLETLVQLRSELGDDPDLAQAIDRLCVGEFEEAESFLTRIAGQGLASAAFAGGRLAENRVDLQQALTLYRQAVEQEPDNPQYLQAAGRVARNLYQYKDALPWLEAFVRLLRQKEASDSLELALALRELAYTYVLSGQYQKSGPLYKESMTSLAKKLGQDHPEMATSWFQIGELQETLGEYDKAVSLYKKAQAILEKKRGPEHPALAAILTKLAALCMELEMEPQAVPLYERLVRIREKALRPNHPQLAISLNSLAESYRLQGRYGDAEACYLKILAINEATHGPEHPSVAAVLQELAKLSTSQRKPEEAKQYQDRASAIFQKSVEATERKSGAASLTLEL